MANIEVFDKTISYYSACFIEIEHCVYVVFLSFAKIEFGNNEAKSSSKKPNS